MNAFGLWTWIAVGVLLTVPVVVFVLFLKDAHALLRQFGQRHGGDSAQT